LLECFEGDGTFIVGGGTPQVIGAEVHIVPAGQKLLINNPHRLPFGIRLYVFTGE
jgi:hypothetical protein